VLACLIALTGLAWAYLLILARQMVSGDMGLMGMANMPAGAMAEAMIMPQPSWSPLTFFLMFFMWSVMMVGMMLPSAAPMILLFARVQRKKLADEAPATRIAAFTSGYVLTWTIFSLLATGLQWLLTELRLLTPMMENNSQYLAAGILFAAGIYQLSPLKHACLQQCQSPVVFLTSHWKAGTYGALRMGIEHGVFCVGCCWLLMALLFVGGIMNLIWVAALAIFVLLEKLSRKGAVIGKASGVLLLAFALYEAIRF